MAFQVKIEKLVYGGDALARYDGVVVFVPGAAPGDVVEVTDVVKKKNFWMAKGFRLLEAGPGRRQAPCPVFGRCGGCQWQHVEYAIQVQAKTAIVRDQLKKSVTPQTLWHPLLTGEEWRYRNRIQVHKRGHQVGFKERASDNLVPVADCLIADERLKEGLQQLQEQTKFQTKFPNGRYEIFLSPDTQGVGIRSAREADERVESAFSQVNEPMNQVMLKVACGVADQLAVTQFFDLYGGAGNFSFPLLQGDSARRGHLVELSPRLCSQAERHRDETKWQTRLSISQKMVEDFLKTTALWTADLIVVDPPRPGLNAEIADQLNQSGCPNILYISCNPSALARDLVRMDQYTCAEVWVLDMFPQTFHVETMVRLSRKSS